MFRQTTTLLLLAVIGLAPNHHADAAALADGSTVELGTPGSKVYVTSPDGRRYPLWDGVHQLDNGARLTIRGGVLSSSPWLPGGGTPQEDSCKLLIERVCGRDGQCEGSTPCELAHQLQDMAAAEPAASAGATTSRSRQCDDALRDSVYFKRCGR